MTEVTLSVPAASGDTEYMPDTDEYAWSDVLTFFPIGRVGSHICRVYIEWNISSIPDTANIKKAAFRYEGQYHGVDCQVREMRAIRPSTQPFDQASRAAVYAEIGEGTVYASPTGFPVSATYQEVDLGVDAIVDIQAQLTSGWFAIGIQSVDEGYADGSIIKSEEAYGVTPPPTLYVEYGTEPSMQSVSFVSVPSSAAVSVDGTQVGVA